MYRNLTLRGGTSQAGQAIGSGLQLDFSKYLNRILEVDPEARTVRVEPGIVLDNLNAHLRAYGLYLPLDISTADRAVIGGMIANNSAGTRSIIYGMTIDYVERLTVMLSDGSIVEMHELQADELQGKLQQDDLEGTCYRTVCDLAAEHAAEIDARSAAGETRRSATRGSTTSSKTCGSYRGRCRSRIHRSTSPRSAPRRSSSCRASA